MGRFSRVSRKEDRRRIGPFFGLSRQQDLSSRTERVFQPHTEIAMTLQKDRQVQIYGVRTARVPGVLGATPQTGHSTDAHGTARLPGPLKIGPSILLMDATITKVAPKTIPMPTPLEDTEKKRVNVVTWDPGDTPQTIDVAQGACRRLPGCCYFGGHGEYSRRFKTLVCGS